MPLTCRPPKQGPASTPDPPSSANRLYLSARHRRKSPRSPAPRAPAGCRGVGLRQSGQRQLSHTESDLDLVLRGPGLEKICRPSSFYRLCGRRKRESTIPFLVEAFIDWARLPEQFQREIERNHIVTCSEVTLPTTMYRWRSCYVSGFDCCQQSSVGWLTDSFEPNSSSFSLHGHGVPVFAAPI